MTLLSYISIPYVTPEGVTKTIKLDLNKENFNNGLSDGLTGKPSTPSNPIFKRQDVNNVIEQCIDKLKKDLV